MRCVIQPDHDDLVRISDRRQQRDIRQRDIRRPAGNEITHCIKRACFQNGLQIRMAKSGGAADLHYAVVTGNAVCVAGRIAITDKFHAVLSSDDVLDPAAIDTPD